MAEKPVPRVPILAVSHLTKTIQQKEILKDLSFSYAYTGPLGSGQNATATYTISGTFDTAGTASGSIALTAN